MDPRFLLLGLAACTKTPPLAWQAPASSGFPADVPCETAPEDLVLAFAEGVTLDGYGTAALLPDLALHASWVAQVDITAWRVDRCGDLVVVTDPLLRFRSRRGEYLDVAVITDALVHPRLILSLQREALRAPPPEGAWLAPDRTTLRHVGPLVLGTLEGE